MALRLELIEDYPNAVIQTWQGIHNEILPWCMAESDAIVSTVVDKFFQAQYLREIACHEFEQILFNAAEKLYITIKSNFNIVQRHRGVQIRAQTLRKAIGANPNGINYLRSDTSMYIMKPMSGQ